LTDSQTHSLSFFHFLIPEKELFSKREKENTLTLLLSESGMGGGGGFDLLSIL